MGTGLDDGQRAGRPPVAWRDGDELVMHVDWPLPRLCVFCGAPAVAELRGAIAPRPFNTSPLTLRTGLPVCDDDRRRIRSARKGANIVGFVLAAWFFFTIVPRMLTASTPTGPWFLARGPGPLLVLVALSALGWCARRVARYWYGEPRPTNLRFRRARGGYVWLAGADPRYLAHLPAVATEPQR